MLSREEKKAKFTSEYLETQQKKRRKIFLGAFVVALLGVGIFVWANSGRYESKTGGNYFLEETPRYDKKTEMKEIKLTVENGLAKIPLQAVRENKIIYTEYKGGDGKKKYYGDLTVMPMMAYVSTAGRVVLSTAICEPCYGTKFYLEGEDLVCVACGTRWRNTDLFGMGGGCVKYPPEELKYEVQGDNLVVPETKLANWQPRYFTDEMSGGKQGQ